MLATVAPDDAHAAVQLALALARCSEFAESEKLASDCLSRKPHDRWLLFQSACVYSVCSTSKDEQLSTRCRDACLKSLAQLIENGWKDGTVFRQDPDLDAIRKDQRFANLLQIHRKDSLQ